MSSVYKNIDISKLDPYSFDVLIGANTKQGTSIWESIVEFMNVNSEKLDEVDIVELISPALKEKIKSELVSKRVLRNGKSFKVPKKLFK